MLDWISRIFPPEIGGPVILAALLWAGTHYLFVGPEIGERLGTIKWQPQCDSDIARMQTENRRVHEEERARIKAAHEKILREADKAMAAARRKAEQNKQLADRMIPRELRNLLDVLTGQPGFTEEMTDMLGAPDLPDVSLQDLPEVPLPLPDASPKERKGFCGCVVQKSLERTRNDLALLSGTLRLYTPASISGFKTTMRDVASSNVCGAIPS